ncbi:MAG: hypothetical protein JWQ49_750 [Edaphobacter sp.]|nr:hypothetical protein [Edaphobacter sp.]
MEFEQSKRLISIRIGFRCKGCQPRMALGPSVENGRRNRVLMSACNGPMRPLELRCLNAASAKRPSPTLPSAQAMPSRNSKLDDSRTHCVSRILLERPSANGVTSPGAAAWCQRRLPAARSHAC